MSNNTKPRSARINKQITQDGRWSNNKNVVVKKIPLLGACSAAQTYALIPMPRIRFLEADDAGA